MPTVDSGVITAGFKGVKSLVEQSRAKAAESSGLAQISDTKEAPRAASPAKQKEAPPPPKQRGPKHKVYTREFLTTLAPYDHQLMLDLQMGRQPSQATIAAANRSMIRSKK